MQSDAGLRWISGTVPTFNNRGTFRKSAGGGATDVSWVFNNAGTVEALSGTLAFSGGLTQTAGVTRLNGGNLALSSSALALQGGTLTGAGTTTGSANNSGGTVSPGNNGPGTLTLTGTYTQGAGGTLNIELGGLTPGTQYDRLAVSGAATLNGTLNVSLISHFFPDLGNTFQVLTYASHTGDFTTKNGLAIGMGRQLDTTAGATDYVLVTNPGMATPTMTAVSAAPNPSVFGQAVTFTATVTPTGGSGTPTGSVTFQDGSSVLGSATLSGGSATFTLATLAVGPHSITAVYGGGGGFSGSTSPALTQTVNQAQTTTAVSSSVNPTVFGQSVTFTATDRQTAPVESTHRWRW